MMAQLGLTLDDEIISIPWDGRNPRDLTRISILLSLKRERGGHEVDPLQYDLLEAPGRSVNRKQCFSYAGAPLMVPLK